MKQFGFVIAKDLEERRMEEFYKSDPEWMEELCISESSLKRARAKLIKGFGIKTEKKGIPAKNYYTVDYDQLRLVLSSFAQSNQSGQNDLTSQVKMNPQDRSEWPDKTGQPDSTITVDYQETTQETTPVEDKTLSISSRTVMESPTTTFSENSKIRTVLKSCWMSLEQESGGKARLSKWANLSEEDQNKAFSEAQSLAKEKPPFSSRLIEQLDIAAKIVTSPKDYSGAAAPHKLEPDLTNKRRGAQEASTNYAESQYDAALQSGADAEEAEAVRNFAYGSYLNRYDPKTWELAKPLTYQYGKEKGQPVTYEDIDSTRVFATAQQITDEMIQADRNSRMNFLAKQARDLSNENS